MTSATPPPKPNRAPVIVKPPAPPASPALPQALGAYTLEEVIGQGGMGTVYKAKRAGLDRVMAVKLINAGAFASDLERHRFRVEAENAAKLQHPNIVQVLEVGDVAGQAYFVMEFVEGPMLSSMVQDKPLPWRQACRYVKTLAEAVQFAHQKGILHRDLKPQNVLIDRFDAPKIADFGLSRQIGYEGGLTVTGQMIGTPNYMPLEQALGEHSKVGPWSDVYSLGAILYELVTTIPPFLGTTIADIVDRLQRQQPISPIGVNPTIPSDLNTVILKCLEKDADQRYASAAELAVELSRVLRDIPIEARPISPPHRLWRWGKRNPALAALSTFAAIMVVAIALVSTFYYWQTSQALTREAHLRQDAERAKSFAETARSELSTALSRSDFLRGLEFINQDIPKPAEGLAYLASSLRHDPKNQAAQTRLVSMLASRAWMVPACSPLKHAGNVIKIVYSRDGKHVLTASYDGTATLWNAKTGEKIRVVGKHAKRLRDACFSPDGKYVATASEDGTAQIWSVANGKATTQWPLKHPTGPVNSVAFDPEGKWLLTAADGGTVALWNAITGEPVPRLGSRTRPLSQGVLFARFSPDGTMIVAGSGSSALLWDVESGSLTQTIMCGGEVSAASFSPNSQQLVVAFTTAATENTSYYAQIYDTKTGVTVGNRMGHGSGIVEAVFSPDGRYVATASLDRTARVWNSQTGNPVTGPLRHPLGLTATVFSPDSRQLLTAGVSGSAMLWNVETGTQEASPLQQSEQIFSVAFSPDGKAIAMGLADNTARIYLIGRPPSPPLEMKQAGVLKARFNAEGDRVLSWGSGTEVFLWDAVTGKLISKLEHPDQGRVGAEWSADGKTILTYQAFRAARLWDGETGKPTSGWLAEDSHLRTATLSPDGRWLLTTLDRNEVGLFDTATGKQSGSYIDVQGSISFVAFSQDARRFGVILGAQGPQGQPESLRVWDVDPLASTEAALGPIHDVPQHEDRINPSGQLQLVWKQDRAAAYLWDFKKGRELSKEMRHGDPISAARFSPDGRFVVTGSSDSTARVWDTATGRPVTPPLQHAGIVHSVAMSADSSSIATITIPSLSSFPLIRRQTKQESTIVVWDKDTDMPVTDPLTHAGQPRDVSFSPNGRQLLVCWSDGSLGIWTIKLEPGVGTPQWLPEIAESLAGMKLNSVGVLETIADPAAQLRTATSQLPTSNIAAEKGKGKGKGAGTTAGGPSLPSNAPPGPLNSLATAITQPGVEKQ